MRTLTVAGVVGSLVLAAAGWTEGGAVAVLVEPGMVRYGGTAALSGHQMVSALRRAGIEADALGVEAVADPERFGAGRVAVLVNPYGNAFPLGAFEAMRAFHRAGGCLVLTGVPFCHPCVRSAPAGWRADGGASWGGEAAWLSEGRGGRRAVRVTNRGRQWAGATSGRFPAKAGQRLTVAGWVRALGGESGRDSLFVRFFDGGVFRGQEGPGVPAAAKDWTLIQRTVAVPEKATAIDVSLQVWSRGARVDLDDVSLSVAGKAKNLVGNPGFEAGGGSWRDLGHKAHFAHDAAGIGTGGFGGPASKEGRLSAAKGNPLGLTDDVLPRRSARPQWLDPSALAREDEVIPLVELRTPGEPVRLAAALIRHRCRAFRGARDAWLGQVASAFTQEDRHAAEQLVVRAVAWCLLEKGKLSRRDYENLLARLASMPKPEPLPDRLEIVQEPRPWGETFFPKSKPPARELLAVDCRRLGRWERLALTCLQGLTSRQRPRLWLVFGPWDERWLAWHKEKGHIGSYRRVEDWRGLFRQFAGSVRGAVVPDERLYRGELLACNLAAVEDCIVAPQALARKLGLKVRHDLRGRFETYAEGMEWLWRTYRDAFSHHLCAYLHPDLVFSGVPAYDIQWRGLIFWVCGEKDADRPGADALAEMRVMAGIFAQMPPNVGMRGFPWHGHGIGLGEGGGVTFCGDYGKALVCTNLTPNVAVMSGVRIERLKPPPQPPTPALDRSKTYIALTMSDGDNLNTFYSYFPRYFEHPAHGKFPVGWGMGPAILDLMPAVAQWHYEKAKAGDEFLADVSGIAYVFPQTYGRRYRERGKVLDGFLDWTARYMDRLGMRTVRPHGGGAGQMACYARKLPALHSIFADYARRGGMTCEKSVYRLPGGVPVFHALTTWRYGRDGLLREIREQVGTRRPAFVNAFLHNWTFDMAALARACERRDADMVFVTPAQLAELYRRACESPTGGPRAP